jgi:hypothetical protein
MMTLERLEKGCNNIYAKAFKEIQTREGEPCFYTPMHKVTITSTCSNLGAFFYAHDSVLI